MMVPPNSALRKPPGPRRRRRPILRPAIVLRQLPDQRGPLPRLFSVAAALDALEIAHHAVEIVTHLLKLRVHRLALRRPSGEQGKKSATLAAKLSRLRQDAIEFPLLLGNRVFIAPHLVGARGIGRAAVKRGELRFVPHADRI